MLSGDTGDKACLAFALSCHDWEDMRYVDTTVGIKIKDIRDLMLAAASHRIGLVHNLRNVVE